MKQILVFLCLVASLLFSAPTMAQDFSALKDEGQAQVVEVITPYTIQLSNGQLIQLSGIHFPDYDPENTGDLSLAALNILKDALIGQRVRIYQTQGTDWGRQNRMGHQLAHLQRIEDGAWIQGLMLSLGLAVTKTTQRTPELAAFMYALEDEARKEKLGFWEHEDAILTPEQAAEHTGSFQIVEGTIAGVAMNKNRLYINFGQNWRDDFTVSVAPADLKRFTENGLNPQQWGGQKIRVRGWIESYNGPYIEIDHPEAIEKLD